MFNVQCSNETLLDNLRNANPGPERTKALKAVIVDAFTPIAEGLAQDDDYLDKVNKDENYDIPEVLKVAYRQDKTAEDLQLQRVFIDIAKKFLTAEIPVIRARNLASPEQVTVDGPETQETKEPVLDTGSATVPLKSSIPYVRNPIWAALRRFVIGLWRVVSGQGVYRMIRSTYSETANDKMSAKQLRFYSLSLPFEGLFWGLFHPAIYLFAKPINAYRDPKGDAALNDEVPADLPKTRFNKAVEYFAVFMGVAVVAMSLVAIATGIGAIPGVPVLSLVAPYVFSGMTSFFGVTTSFAPILWPLMYCVGAAMLSGLGVIATLGIPKAEPKSAKPEELKEVRKQEKRVSKELDANPDFSIPMPSLFNGEGDLEKDKRALFGAFMNETSALPGVAKPFYSPDEIDHIENDFIRKHGEAECNKFIVEYAQFLLSDQKYTADLLSILEEDLGSEARKNLRSDFTNKFPGIAVSERVLAAWDAARPKEVSASTRTMLAITAPTPQNLAKDKEEANESKQGAANESWSDWALRKFGW